MGDKLIQQSFRTLRTLKISCNCWDYRKLIPHEVFDVMRKVISLVTNRDLASLTEICLISLSEIPEGDWAGPGLPMELNAWLSDLRMACEKTHVKLHAEEVTRSTHGLPKQFERCSLCQSV